MTLTVKQIEAALFGREKERLCDGNGLYLRLYPSGKKSFQVMVAKSKEEKGRLWVTLGDFPSLGLKEAREVANLVRLQSRRGWSAKQIRVGLKAEDLTLPEETTAPDCLSQTLFRDVAKVWFERKAPGLKNGKHIDQNWNTIRDYVLPKLGDRPVSEITGLEIIETLRPIWHIINETARRTLGRVQEIFELAVLEYGVPANPAFFKTHVAFGKVRRVTQHFGSLHWAAMPEFWAWLQNAPCAEQTRQLVMLLALSAKRTCEVRKARAEFMPKYSKVWTTPEELMKAARPHSVPMSRQMLIVWENAKLISDYPDLLFGRASNKSGLISENTARNLVKQFDPVMTGHGFRASFKGWARAQKRYERDAIEFALAHRLPPLEEAYFREDLLEEREVLMQDWADFICNGQDPVDLSERLAAGGSDQSNLRFHVGCLGVPSQVVQRSE